MKKIINKIKDFFTDEGNLDFLWYISYVFWFGFVGRIIIVSEIHIAFKIIMIIGDLWWALYVFIQHFNSNKE